jgi:hypothetical protein
MKALSLGAALTSATSNASVKGEDTDVVFQRGGVAIGVLMPTNGAFVGTAKIQGTNDLDSVADGSASWTDLLTFTAPASNSGMKMGQVTLYRRMRVTVSAFTSGSVEGQLLG